MQGSLFCVSVTAKHVHLYVLQLVGERYAAHCRHQGGGCGASVPAAKHVHLYVLLLVGGRDAAHGRHQAGVADAHRAPVAQVLALKVVFNIEITTLEQKNQEILNKQK